MARRGPAGTTRRPSLNLTHCAATRTALPAGTSSSVEAREGLARVGTPTPRYCPLITLASWGRGHRPATSFRYDPSSPHCTALTTAATSLLVILLLLPPHTRPRPSQRKHTPLHLTPNTYTCHARAGRPSIAPAAAAAAAAQWQVSSVQCPVSSVQCPVPAAASRGAPCNEGRLR
ncbi:hypothetical protein E2C01_071768 [Portunus trituberculatus]|uniref:Uncharacterized protein n=1 Tax=Portunus trituberculatus TaxID=210409 RepID=A0A5B7I5X6_PORTR|nr:hypothetical protein [Portunus trituberculatus]